jgi:predicted metal-binding membrane protein
MRRAIVPGYAVRMSFGPSGGSVLGVAASERALFVASSLLFVLSTVATIVWTAAMPAMSEMPMPGGWAMSMIWMRMPGQTWAGAAASFTGMWSTMMMAMMSPCLFPVLVRYRQELRGSGERRLNRPTAMFALGYFCVWILLGLVAYPFGAGLAAIEMQQAALARAIPSLTAVIVLIAGVLQFSSWKAHHLACCREAPGRRSAPRADVGSAWHLGVRLGTHCMHSCAGLTALLLAAGVMDLRAMAAITAAINLERLAPARARPERLVGTLILAVGIFLSMKAVSIP